MSDEDEVIPEAKRRGDPKSYNRRYESRHKSSKKRRSSSSTTSSSQGSSNSFSFPSTTHSSGSGSFEMGRESGNTVVVDGGAYSIKIGHIGEKEPSIIPNCIMKARSERKRLFIGDQITDCRDCSGLYFLLPCERGYITKWDVQKPIWDYMFSKNMYNIQDKEVIMTQPLFNFKSIQDCMDEIFFEEYDVKSMLRPNPTDMAKLKYNYDKKIPNDTPCVIVDTGFSFTHVVPYINGHKYLKAMKRINVGGKLLTNHLKDLISYRQYNVMEETYVINQVKEDTCYVAKNIKTELEAAGKPGNSIIKNYVLPDFNNIRRGYIQDPNNITELEECCQILRLNNERFIVPEILFHPSDIGMKSMGIAEAIIKSIEECPEEYRKSLAEHIVVVGGNCKFPGFRERIFNEVRSLLPDYWKVNVYVPDDPISYTWKSGKALTKYPYYKALLVTKEEYDELGSTLIQARFQHWNNFKEPDETDSLEDRPKFQPSILNKIKGKSIFGKADVYPYAVDELPPTPSYSSLSLSEESSRRPSLDTNEPEETSPVDEIPIEHIPLKPKKAKKESIMEDDLSESLDLFPFGSNTYV